MADDGRGLDTERIKAKALASGLATEAELDKMSEAQIQKFIFTPGFSTAAKVTSVSGRGVGMDVVRNNIDQIGGSIDVSSIRGRRVELHDQDSADARDHLGPDRGSRRRPLRDPAAFGGRAGARSRQVRAPHRAHQGRGGAAAAQQAVAAGAASSSAAARWTAIRRFRSKGFIVVTQVGAQTFGLVVDNVFHTEEIVVKPMSTMLRHIGMFSGNTILGDGSVIMIVDPNGVAQEVGTSVASTPSAHHDEAPRPARRASENPSSLLVFRAGSPEPKAVPLSLVTRLEEIDCRKIELSNNRHMVQYRGQLMPLVRVNDDVRIKAEGNQPLLVFSDAGRSMGLVVDEIVDIVEEQSRHSGRQRPAGRARLGGDSRPSDRDSRRRAFPAAGLRRLVRAQGCAQVAQSPRTLLLVDDFGVLPQHAVRRCSRPPATR